MIIDQIDWIVYLELFCAQFYFHFLHQHIITSKPLVVEYDLNVAGLLIHLFFIFLVLVYQLILYVTED